MDYIEVVDLEVFAHHGVLDFEKRDGQTFFISFKAYLDIEPSAMDDDLNLSVSYADMCQTVKAFVQAETYDLIETVADRCAKEALGNISLARKGRAMGQKPSAPIGQPVAYPSVYVDRKWTTAYIGMGSNLGDREATIKGALKALDANDHKLIQVAKIIETEPWGTVPQDSFLNTVAKIKTLLKPAMLMDNLLDIEANFGRTREVKWGPRTLDLDIIFYGDVISEDPHVVLPHPYVHERAFVLESLMELCPYKVHPLLGHRVCDLYKALSTEQL